ncbi:MAG: hypothetical protein JNL35_10085 [Sphingopyxis sp.]|nr:hypothetical protein [Sphingopyxis sp.]
MSRFPIWFTIAIGVAVLFFLVVPFGAGTGLGARIFFSILMGAFIAGGAAVILSFVRDLAGLFHRRDAPQPASPQPRRPPAELTPARKAAVRKVVAVMAEHGLFAPEVPDPALLYAGVADMDESVKPDTILSVLEEASYYNPDADPAAWMANLAMHDSKAEQDEAQQIADLVRLANGGVAVDDLRIDHGPEVARCIPVTITMTVNGEPLSLAYAGDAKYLSTHLHHALAARLEAANIGRRFAWLWTDQGAWISALPSGAVEALNAAFKLTPQSRCCWEWVADAQPFAAGDPP